MNGSLISWSMFSRNIVVLLSFRDPSKADNFVVVDFLSFSGILVVITTTDDLFDIRSQDECLSRVSKMAPTTYQMLM